MTVKQNINLYLVPYFPKKKKKKLFLLSGNQEPHHSLDTLTIQQPITHLSTKSNYSDMTTFFKSVQFPVHFFHDLEEEKEISCGIFLQPAFQTWGNQPTELC